MKLRTKLTALCAGLLFLVTVSLSAAMLWQVREQSYGALRSQSEETLEAVTAAFERAVYRDYPEAGSPRTKRVFLNYCFRSCGVPGSVLVVNGARLAALTPIAPEAYLELPAIGGIQSARCRIGGTPYLILGKRLDILEDQCSVYLAADASAISGALLQLAGRFAVLALSVGLVGLAAVRWLIRRTLRPLSALSEAAGQIAAGSYSQRVPEKTRDEVGLLAGSFNRMAGAVEEQVRTLQEQNARQRLFLGAVTHELKTPLTSLLLNVNTLQTVYLSEEKQASILESMDTQLRWLETMVRKLLTLLSMRRSAKLSPVSVPALLDRVQALTGDICGKYGVSLEVTGNVDVLSVDEDLISSALVNLVENSAKASQPGQKIWLTAEETGFTVTDWGRGIPQKDLERVTEPFYMGDPSRSKAGGGFGLGLALVKEIAAVHGGCLELESAPGQGTTARLRLGGNQTVTGR